MTTKKRILHIIWEGRIGGAERFLWDVFRYTDHDEFEHAICFLASGGQLEEKIEQLQGKVYVLGMTNGRSIFKALGFLTVVADFKPDVVHCHARNYLINVLLKYYSHIRKVYSEHGGCFDPTTSSSDLARYQRFYKKFVSGYDLVYTNAEYLRVRIKAWTGLNDDRVRMYHYGIDVSRYGQSRRQDQLRAEWLKDGQDKVIGIVGRLVEQKGIDDFIKIAAQIQNSQKNCRFVIVGDGPLRATLEQQAHELQVDALFLGARHDLTDILAAFDIFVFTSKWEPFGIIVLETLASKTPLVGFEVDGMKAIIEKGGGGWLVADRCHDGVAEAVIDLLEDQNKYQQIQDMGYKNVCQNFEVRKTIAALDHDYTLMT